ncbi:MAG: glycerate kinase [Deltaproteobacteria bacterium]|nr:glycerate kinase [Deltaproteobacteria bacterium]
MPRNLREKASAIINAALRAVDPAQAVKAALQREGDLLRVGGETLDLTTFRRVIVVGAGKAGAPMAQAVEEILGDRLDRGLVVVKDGHTLPTRRVELREASHPVPDRRGVEAAGEIRQLVAGEAAPDTLFLCLISGGGSALLVEPATGLSLADKQETTRLLLASGADIAEMNTIRKHLSALKGGQLARLAEPGRLVTLIISDVVGDRLDVIASGPTVADLTTWADAERVLETRGIVDKAPPAVWSRIQAGLAGELPETPKPGDSCLTRVSNLVISNNRRAMAAAAAEAQAQGFTPLVLSTTIEGETRDVARMHAAIAREVRASGQPLAAPCALLSGGETTVTLGEVCGAGGRNQEFALAAALDLAGLADVLAVSFGTDGTDGPTDAAGAWADGLTVERARALDLDPREVLARHDAYPFFQKLGDLIITGPTLTNVMDVRLMLVG